MAFKLDSDLSAVNSILGAIGQAPVTTLNYENPELGLIMNLLKETTVDVQTEGWYFNTENDIPFAITGGNGQFANRIIVPGNVLNMNVSGGQVFRSIQSGEPVCKLGDWVLWGINVDAIFFFDELGLRI